MSNWWASTAQRVETEGRGDEAVIGYQGPVTRVRVVGQFAAVEGGWGVHWWEMYGEVA